MKTAILLAGSLGSILLPFIFSGPQKIGPVPALTAAAFSPDACLPIEMPTRDTMFASGRKVFAHYFNRLPLSIDNKAAAADYYTIEYLTPSGESNKWLAQGGYLRSRPSAVAAPKQNFVIENLKQEVRLAISRGIGGFTFDILTLDDVKPNGYLQNMLAAIQAVEPRFQIVIMPDMASLQGSTAAVIEIVRTLYAAPSVYHWQGKLVVAPFLSESVSPQTWDLMLRQLEDEGLSISFFPTFLGLQQSYVDSYRSLSVGFGTFGTPLPGQIDWVAKDTAVSHAAGKPYMAGISGQGYRPKDYMYWEARGSLAYRNGWTGAIRGGADAVQLTTWNDFGESTSISPITDRDGGSGTGYFNLTGYYASWFLTGVQPVITHDVLYYFYRKQLVGADSPNAGRRTVLAENGGPSADEIELVAYLKAPGTLSISSNGNTSSASVAAGMQSLRAPLGAGRPRFSLSRNSATVIAFDGQTTIVGQSGLATGYADLTYWSGSGSAKGTCFSDAFALGTVTAPTGLRVSSN